MKLDKMLVLVSGEGGGWRQDRFLIPWLLLLWWRQWSRCMH